MSAVTASQPNVGQRLVNKIRSDYGYTVLSFVIGIVLWELVVRFVAPGVITLAPPTDVAVALYDLLLQGDIYEAWLGSIQYMLMGYILAAVIAIPLGFSMARSTRIRWAVNPFIDALYATPVIAWLPIIIAWLGLFFWARVAVVFLIAFFEMLINTFTGVSSIDEKYIETATSFDLTWWQRQRMVMFPASLPYVFAGLHLGAGRAVRGMIVAELFLALVNLGQLLEEAAQFYQTDIQIAVIVTITLTGIALQNIVLYAKKKTIPWSITTEGE